MACRPACALFDVVGTLFSLDQARRAFAQRGLPELATELWFQRLLRDGMALDAAETFVPFDRVATATLAVLGAARGWPLAHDDVEALVRSLSQLEAYPDAEPAFRLLAQAGIAIVALTNGGKDATETLLARARLDRYVRDIITIEEARHWKPRREVYLHAANRVGLPPGDVALVAAHAWDVHGARKAGLVTGWVSRLERRRHDEMEAPDVEGETLIDVVGALVRLPRGTPAGLHP